MVFNFRKRAVAEEITPASTSSSEVIEVTGVEALNTLKGFEEQHKLDPNLPIEELNEVDTALASGDTEKGVEIETALLEENSPYPEVGLYPSRLRPAKISKRVKRCAPQ